MKQGTGQIRKTSGQKFQPGNRDKYVTIRGRNTLYRTKATGCYRGCGTIAGPLPEGDEVSDEVVQALFGIDSYTLYEHLTELRLFLNPGVWV